jgi:transposase
MQYFGLHKSIYKLKKLIIPEQNFIPAISEIREKVKKWEKLKAYKVPDKEIASVTGMSRASFYRHKKSISIYGLKGLERRSKRPKTLRSSKVPVSIIELILKLRQENPTYGKAKITVLLRRDHGVLLSESSVGRILKNLMIKGKILPSISCCRIKRRRKFKSHAKAWRYGMKAQSPGELIQIDHMTVTKHNISMKEFRAWDPVTKVMVADLTSNATSFAAAKFLNKVIKEFPFAVKSIQVDGGSEFMKDFENQCMQLNIPLFVLPPSRPQYNGGVERANRIFREEFYARSDLQAESISAFRIELKRAVEKYNSYRPHFSLNGLTPFEYTKLVLAA